VTRALCLGLEAVLADGRVLNLLTGLHKDNTGYDLRDLFIGSEGTLGVITAATLKLYPQPAARMTALAAVASPHAALRLLELAQRRLAATLTGFEMMSRLCGELVARHVPSAAVPLAAANPYCVLLESSDPHSEANAAQTFERLLEEAFEAGIITDAAVAASIAQSRAFWALRENIPLAQATEGDNIKHDISVPISAIGDFVERTNAMLEQTFPGIRMVVFGHLGDGNLHYNVNAPEGAGGARFMADEPAINAIVYDAVAQAGGSISAEHGLGQLKVAENQHYKSAIELSLMARLKATFDPLGIMNPGKVMPVT
ncbi:MAG: FAD-binding oxidoreductase, partial [Burkholderiaceae bacterium]